MKSLHSAPPCTNDTAMETYFNSPEVKKALHVDMDKEWTLCNEDLGYETQGASFLNF